MAVFEKGLVWIDLDKVSDTKVHDSGKGIIVVMQRPVPDNGECMDVYISDDETIQEFEQALDANRK